MVVPALFIMGIICLVAGIYKLHAKVKWLIACDITEGLWLLALAAGCFIYAMGILFNK